LHASANKASYELRLAKYALRGFGVAVPGLDKKRVGTDHIRLHNLGELKGLARLLKVSFAMEQEIVAASWRSLPSTPLYNKELSGHARIAMSKCELLVKGGGSYMEEPDGVIVPRVFGNGTFGDGRIAGYLWFNDVGGDLSDFPLASEVRDGAWAEIEDATGMPASVENVPDRLHDAWQINKRSREYLNAQSMDKFDWDNQYYSHAYQNDDEKTG